MKKMNIVWIVSGLIVTIMLYFLNKIRGNKRSTIKNERSNKVINPNHLKNENEINDLLNNKQNISDSISYRHTIAEEIIKEILNDEEDIDISEHNLKEEFNEIDSSLDELLK